MRTRTILALAATIGCAALGIFAATGLGDDERAPDDRDRFEIVRPSLEASDAAPALRVAGKRKPKPPSVTNLITTNPVAVPANDEIVAELACTRAQGIPLSGGAISPPAPAQVAISVLSRFSPNPPFEATAGSYFVGVRNLDPVNPAEFRATLVCAKGVSEK